LTLTTLLFYNFEFEIISYYKVLGVLQSLAYLHGMQVNAAKALKAVWAGNETKHELDRDVGLATAYRLRCCLHKLMTPAFLAFLEKAKLDEGLLNPHISIVDLKTDGEQHIMGVVVASMIGTVKNASDSLSKLFDVNFREYALKPKHLRDVTKIKTLVRLNSTAAYYVHQTKPRAFRPHSFPILEPRHVSTFLQSLGY
jgi:hypothetical protein